MRRALPVPQRVMAVVLSALFVLCPLAAYAAGEEADAVPLPIIMYHEVKPDKSGKDAIQPWEFEADLKWLLEQETAFWDHVEAGTMPAQTLIL